MPEVKYMKYLLDEADQVPKVADKLVDLVNRQKQFMAHLATFSNCDFFGDELSMSEIIQRNLACMTNEIEEIRDWLPWKHWKKYSGNIDVTEIKFEYIDLLHFALEGMICLGMDADEIYKFYVLKNRENFRRQREGY